MQQHSMPLHKPSAAGGEVTRAADDQSKRIAAQGMKSAPLTDSNIMHGSCTCSQHACWADRDTCKCALRMKIPCGRYSIIPLV